MVKSDGSEEEYPDPMSIPSSLPRNICPSTCIICGRRASGYHYEVASCNGCKTFFRRTVLAQKSFACPKSGTCFADLPIEYRNGILLCRACRYERCIEVGMNPNGIRTKKLGNNATVRNILERRMSEASTSCDRSPGSIHSPGPDVERLIDSLQDIEKIKLEASYDGTRSIEQYFKMKDALTEEPADNDVDVSFMLHHMFSPFQRLSRSWTLADLLPAVDYIRSLFFFSSLSEDDQQLLLKRGALLCFNFTQAYHWRHAGSPISNEFRCSALTEKVQSQLIDGMDRMGINQQEYVLIKALVVCSSGIEDLSDRGQEILEEEREKLSNALFRHCLYIDSLNGPARYAASLCVINSLEFVTQDQKNLHAFLKMSHPHSSWILEELTK